ncbi:bifunctional adenosylcobinamide kinase/adenosylcobinamide-phosphate guanylyltransferase [Puia sp. P3]|uniref:bifunctional adenosylcobinamide kinase/adenosylcobinamide-phosphate guanylyltransferase n=1 Tax=Puia sp. P3 TaxID=3423952 RepID=UPI003D66A515
MAGITFITGGARSGKSKYAQLLALERSQQPVFVATARVWDADFMERIDKHRDQRGPEWTTFEEEKQLSRLPLEGKAGGDRLRHAMDHQLFCG